MRLLARTLLLLCLFTPFLATAQTWQTLDPDELSRTASTIEPGAHAEVVYRHMEISFDDSYSYMTEHQVVRLFDAKGVESFSVVSFPFSKADDYVIRLAARVIKRDGTITEYKKLDSYPRTGTRDGKSVGEMAFSVPGLEPGAVLEFYYLVRQGDPKYVHSYFFQTEFPTRLSRISYAPVRVGRSGIKFRYITFLAGDPDPTKEKTGIYQFTMENQPSAATEKFTPPRTNILPNVLFYYSDASGGKPDVYWQNFANKLKTTADAKTKANKAINELVARLAPPSLSREERINALYNFVATQITPNNKVALEKRRTLPANKNAAETLKSGHGSREERTILFLALVRAAGFEANLVACNDRDYLLFGASIIEDQLMLPDRAVALYGPEGVTYYQPAVPFLPPGQLSPENTATAFIEGVPTRSAKLENSVPPPPQFAHRYRSGEFQIEADGALSGRVIIHYRGYRAQSLKLSMDGLTAKEREDQIRDGIKAIHPLAEVDAIVLNADGDPTEPASVSYTIRVPNYAERTGSRLFVQTAFFQFGEEALFTAPTRRADLLFDYRYVNHDRVAIKLPEGYSLEDPESPNSLEGGGYANYQVTMHYNAQRREVIHDRRYTHNAIRIGADLYAAIAQFHEAIRGRDQHTITFRRDPATTASKD
jgi:hypothetical protein